MLMNFCDPSLLTEVKCSTINTEGYEVTNLINNGNNGFMVYSSIRPPVHIDFTFICKIQISHILIWPCVGAQKSSGFRLLLKSNNADDNYEDVSVAFLKSTDSGIFFYRKDFNYSMISHPVDFLQRYVKLSKDGLINGTNGIRISIIKTENSVPAINKVEIWGNVSSICGKSTKMTVEKLWKKCHFHKVINISNKPQAVDINDCEKIERESKSQSLTVPEDFVDPITCEIMTQPIILPSGKIIDQTTLEKHEKNEATWGRRLSDPFTGIPLNENRKPIAAFALKERIDKYLLENNETEEIKKMPRVLGTKYRPSISSVSVFSGTSQETFHLKKDNPKNPKNISILQSTHKLPFSALQQPKRSYNSKLCRVTQKKLKIDETELSQDNYIVEEITSKVSLEKNLELSIQKVLSGCKRFNKLENHKSETVPFVCNCCTNKIFYRLPCQHIVCRQVLIVNKNNKCNSCGAVYSSSDPVRTFS